MRMDEIRSDGKEVGSKKLVMLYIIIIQINLQLYGLRFGLRM